MKMIKQLSLLLLIGCLMPIMSNAQNFSKEEAQFLKKFFKLSTGMYTNKKQAETTKSPHLRLSEARWFPVMKHKKGEYWMSIGWYMPGDPKKPMGEKILHAIKTEDGKIRLEIYSFPKDFEDRKFLEWKKRNPYADLDPVKDLQKDACSLSLDLADDGKSYLMKCEEDAPCPIFSPLAPFDKIWFHFEMRPKQALAFNKHYTPKGKVIIDYTDEPLRMDRVKTNPKTF